MHKLRFISVALLAALVFGGTTLARAQGVSAYFGFGAATDKSNGLFLENVGDSSSSSTIITNPDVGPKLTGAFGIFGADFMWKPHLGFGGEYTWRASKGQFAPQESLTYRPVFYDFNAIWHPLKTGSRVVPELQGGLGGANTKFFFTQSGCATTVTACATISQFLTSSNHFQLHFSGGVRLYAKGNFYVRPQFDLHWVHNFVEFGSDIVPEYSVVIGYTFGER